MAVFVYLIWLCAACLSGATQIKQPAAGHGADTSQGFPAVSMGVNTPTGSASSSGSMTAFHPVASTANAPSPAAGFASSPAASAASSTGASSTSSTHFMANTYGFLRASSNSVGQAVGSMLDIQGNLDDMSKDLSTEYSHWMRKKKTLVAERDNLHKQIAQLRTILQEQKSMREEKVRLQAELSLRQNESRTINVSIEADRLRWKLEKGAMEKDVVLLEEQAQHVQHDTKVAVDATLNKTSMLRDRNRGLQTQIFEENRQLLIEQVENSKLAVIYQRNRSALLEEIQDVQKRIHGLQAQQVAQAQLRDELLRARRHLAAQVAETVRQRRLIRDAQAKCLADSKRIDDDLEAAARRLAEANQELRKCQDVDAENQGLQERINRCKQR